MFSLGRSPQVMELFQAAKKLGFAIPAVNVTSSSTANGCMEAAASLNSPIILQVMLWFGSHAFFSGIYSSVLVAVREAHASWQPCLLPTPTISADRRFFRLMLLSFLLKIGFKDGVDSLRLCVGIFTLEVRTCFSSRFPWRRAFWGSVACTDMSPRLLFSLAWATFLWHLLDDLFGRATAVVQTALIYFSQLSREGAWIRPSPVTNATERLSLL